MVRAAFLEKVAHFSLWRKNIFLFNIIIEYDGYGKESHGAIVCKDFDRNGII